MQIAPTLLADLRESVSV